jgi:RNA polymerase sigma factor (sigma-70 family)
MEAAVSATPSGGFAGAAEVGRLYAAQAVRVRQRVRLGVRAPDAVIDDACQIAWSRLLHHRARVRAETAPAWLVVTALREAYRMLNRQEREPSLEGMLEAVGDIHGRGRGPGLDELVAQRARLEAIGALPERQQRLVWLQGFGCSYEEMAAITGATVRTVERQLLNARRTLAQAES